MTLRTLDERLGVSFEPWADWDGPGEVSLSWHPGAFDAAASSLRAAREMAAGIAAVEDRYEAANEGNRSYWTLSRYLEVFDFEDNWDLPSFLPAVDNINRWLRKWGYREIRYRAPEESTQ